MASSIITEYLGSGLASARPVTPDVASGVLALYYATDTNTLSVWDGSAWDDVGGGGGGGGGGAGQPWYFNPPLAASFPFASNSTVSPMVLTNDSDAGLLMQMGTPSAGFVKSQVSKAIAAPASDWSVKTRLSGRVARGSGNYVSVGLMLLESGTGKITCFNPTASESGTWRLAITDWSTLGAGGFTRHIYNEIEDSVPQWLRVDFTASTGTLTYFRSDSGKNWSAFTSVLANTSFTVRPDRVGFACVYNLGGTDPEALMTCDYWEESW